MLQILILYPWSQLHNILLGEPKIAQKETKWYFVNHSEASSETAIQYDSCKRTS